MKPPSKFFAICYLLFAICAAGAARAACSIANLTKCIDSACDTAPEYGAASRCIICGTTAAATANPALANYKYGGAVTGLTALAIGYSSSTVLDTKNAPTDPGKRYAWAAQQCIGKNAGCTADDVAKNYDKLIDQSCRAALSEKEYESTFAQWKSNQKSESVCRADIQNCMTATTRCGMNFVNCEADTDLDRTFASCAIETSCNNLGTDFSTGVGVDPTAAIKATMVAARDAYFSARTELLKSTVAAHQAARAKRIATARAGCTDGSLKDACVATVCGYISNNNCDGNAEKKSIAYTVCGYIDVACSRIK